MYREFRNIHELKEVVENLNLENLDKFIEEKIYGIAHLTKPKTQMLQNEEGYYCSNCDYQLIGAGVCITYCLGCTVPFACCDETDEPCDRCYENSKNLVKKLYNRN